MFTANRIDLIVMSALVGLTVACSSEGGKSEPDDPVRRYEPRDRMDEDNVFAYASGVIDNVRFVSESDARRPVSFADGLPHALDLPEPPRSGFRLVVPPFDLQPFEEVTFCIAWDIPRLSSNYVYAGELHTTSGLHHGNLLSFPVSAEKGPQPYPSCRPGAQDFFSSFAGTFQIPDVMMVNSTQVQGSEHFVMPEGHAFFLNPDKEAIIDVHLVNITGEAQRVEIVYDFFTMPEEELTDEVVPFVFTIQDFRLPAQQEKTLTNTCDLHGGNLVALMPHMHEWGEAFDVDLIDAEARSANIYHREGVNFTESDIHNFDPTRPTEGFEQLRYQCHFNNTLDHDMVFGIGENEMCILFGYMTPPANQTVGIAMYEDQPCISAQIGLLRGYDTLPEAIEGIGGGDLTVFLDRLGVSMEDLQLLIRMLGL